MKLVSKTLILASLLAFIAFAQEFETDDDFTLRLEVAVEQLPRNPFGTSARTNQSVSNVVELVPSEPGKMLSLITNYPTVNAQQNAVMAFIVAGEKVDTNLLPSFSALLKTPEYSVPVATLLPHLGTNGMAVLASGLTNTNWYIRQQSAAHLTYPLAFGGFSLDEIDDQYIGKYRGNAGLFATNWLKAIYDPEPRVGAAALWLGDGNAIGQTINPANR